MLCKVCTAVLKVELINYQHLPMSAFVLRNVHEPYAVQSNETITLPFFSSKYLNNLNITWCASSFEVWTCIDIFLNCIMHLFKCPFIFLWVCSFKRLYCVYFVSFCGCSLFLGWGLVGVTVITTGCYHPLSISKSCDRILLREVIGWNPYQIKPMIYKDYGCN